MDLRFQSSAEHILNILRTFVLVFSILFATFVLFASRGLTEVSKLSKKNSILTIIDNAHPEFATVGFWQTFSGGSEFYGTDYRQTSGGNGSKVATWTFRVTGGKYKIRGRWTSNPNRAPDASYSIINNGSKLDTVFVNQRLDGGKFNLLGTYNLNAGKLEVVLTDKASGSVVADAVKIITSQGVRIVSPPDIDLKTSSSVSVKALLGGFPSNWGVRFVVKRKASGTVVMQTVDSNSPYQFVASGLSLNEYTIEARVINAFGANQTFFDNTGFGIGDYYVGFGDSITAGSGDDDPSDDKSGDGRDIGGGYEPILNDMLTNNKGYPHTVKNEGVGGNRSIDGRNRVSNILSKHEESQYFLILFGTNDAKSSPPVPSGLGLSPGMSGYNGTYKDNMQRIINAVMNSGKLPLLAKVPYALGPCNACDPFPNPDNAPQNSLIREYNKVINELKLANGLPVKPPNFYQLFRRNYLNDSGSKFADNLHPNGSGYRAIANLWKKSLIE